MLTARSYQQEANDAVLEYWRAGGGNPLVDMATGLGKSVSVALLTHHLLTNYAGMRVLMLVPSRELVAQNFQALLRSWPNAPAGIYCAGLRRWESHHPITFASIQSVYKKAAALGPIDVVLIDEAHLVPPSEEGMYRELLAALRELRPDLRVCGFTATPFRTGSGRLDEGEGRLFDETVYSYGIADGITDGWLVPLVSRRGTTEIDLRGVGRSGGDFNQTALAAAADVDELTKAVVAEAMILGTGRRSWLPFCSSVKHAEHVCDALRMAGVAAECVTGKTKNRDTFIDLFKRRLTRALVSKGVLTTGFDAPVVDLIVLLFSTLSPVLLVQILGRGTRPMWPSGFDPNTATKAERLAVIAASDKPDCMVLDYGGNIRRHGPVDQIEVETKRKRLTKEDMQVKPETVRAKECPVCQSMAGLAARVCKTCGHEWPPVVEHEAEADDAPILSREAPPVLPNDQPVMSWTATKHIKAGSPPSLRIEYLAGLLSVREWIALEHGGHPRHKAGEWWARHGGQAPTPKTVDDAIVRFGELTRPSHIITRKNGKWHDIVGRRFDTEQQEQAA